MATKKKRAIQMTRVLDYMKLHDGITVVEAIVSMEPPILALPRRIKDLRNQGYNIEGVWQKRPNGEKFKLYRLVD